MADALRKIGEDYSATALSRGGAWLVFATALVCSACSDSVDLPEDRVWVAEQVRYHTRADDEVCSGVADTVLRHAQRIAEGFGTPLEASSVIDYYKYRDAADIEGSGVCPSRARACSSGRSAWSSAAVDRHELTHVYFSSLAPSLHLLEEGAAEALSCGLPAVGPPSLWPSIDEALGTPYEEQTESLYAQAGHFVGFLINTYGAERFLEFRRAVAPDTAPDMVAQTFEATYGTELAGVWQAAAIAAPELGCVRWWECSGPPLSLGDWQPLENDCDHADTFRTFDVTQRSAYLFQTLSGASAQLLSCDPKRPVPRGALAVDSVADFYTLEPGRYFMGAAQPGWPARLDEVTADGAECTAPATLNVLAANLTAGVTIHADEKSTNWVTLAGLDVVLGPLEAIFPAGVRLSACQGCAVDSHCVDLTSGDRVDVTGDLVFEVNATLALAEDRWFRLTNRLSSP
jgi:hypothetical protein